MPLLCKAPAGSLCAGMCYVWHASACLCSSAPALCADSQHLPTTANVHSHHIHALCPHAAAVPVIHLLQTNSLLLLWVRFHLSSHDSMHGSQLLQLSPVACRCGVVWLAAPACLTELAAGCRLEQAKIAKLYETFRHVHKLDKSLDEAVDHVLGYA